jgi:hypothetical protein
VISGINNVNINARQFAAGTYVVKVQTGGEVIVTKFNKR